MTNEIIPYLEMCQRESLSLQRGMNYRAHTDYSIILMSLRVNAPYRDELEGDGSTLIYEGHDAQRTQAVHDPKLLDQPEFTPAGRPTENGKFYKAAQDYKSGQRGPELVKVYEKIHGGIWSYNGLFHLVDSWRETDGRRTVFKFKLVAVDDASADASPPEGPSTEMRRIIPTAVKLEVWKRDGGMCVVCGQTTELHFDHIIPYSKGGTSRNADNVQILCARHNLEKRDKIE